MAEPTDDDLMHARALLLASAGLIAAAITEARAEGRAQGRAEERKAVVLYMRGRVGASWRFGLTADLLERGEHLPPGGDDGKT